MRSSSPATVFFLRLIFLFILNFPALSHPFSRPNNLTLYGDTFFRNNSISLTHHRSCISQNSSSTGIGRALYVYPIKFLEPSTNTTASFSCRFSFTIIPSLTCPFGDGFAFLITSNADSFSFSDGYMGLPDPTLDPRDSFVAVEFDTSFDQIQGDINDNHIGVDVNSAVSFASVDAISKGVDLKSGKEMKAWIEYSDDLKLIRVWVGYLPVKPPSPVLAVQIDLSKKFKEFMHVGFSASTGSGSALHVIEHWKFRTFGSYPKMDEEEDNNCLLCSPEELHSNNGSLKNHHKGINFRVSVLGFRFVFPIVYFLTVLGSILILVAVTVVFLNRKKRIRRTEKEEGEDDQNCRINRMPARLSLAEIQSATMGFNQNKILGTGASATVYRGTLPSVGSVAVKRFDRSSWPQCNRNPFTTEFATMAGCFRHKNLVQFKGWCCEGAETALVFEFLPNGSLNNLLHKKPGVERPITLSWKQRVNVILGVASALSYLHEECERQIIHRDVKSCNILLDSDFNAKLGDFGLAEVYEHSSAVGNRDATIPAGTMGYLAPEYVYSGVPTVKTDVYSFGVVVLEVCTGRRPVEEDGTVLVDWLWSLWEKGRLLDCADVMLTGGFDAAEMERVLMVGMVCAHPNCEKRPSIKDAARVIRGEAPLPVLPARRPTIRIGSAAAVTAEVGLVDGGAEMEAPWCTPKSHFSLKQVSLGI